MKRSIQLDSELARREEEVVLEIDRWVLSKWALEVTLLCHRLVESVSLLAPNGTVILGLQRDEDHRRHAKVAFPGARSVRFELPRNQAEHLQDFLLRAYRDEMADVDHLHIEGESEESQFDLTLMFNASRPPMDPDEAARLLG